MKRQKIMKSIEAVVISGAGRGGAQRGVFRPELLEIVWKQPACDSLTAAAGPGLFRCPTP